jgi:hypothetical protein
MNPVKWLKCLFRNYHRRLIPDMAFLFDDDLNTTWPGRCRDCGNVKKRTGKYWASLSNRPKISVRAPREPQERKDA